MSRERSKDGKGLGVEASRSDAPSGPVSGTAEIERAARDSHSSGLIVRSVLLDVPAHKVDRLLVAICELPVADGERAVVEAMCAALADVFPGAGVGICVASADEGGQLIVRRAAPGFEEPQGARDPSRLFPFYATERVEALDEAGSSLHVAFPEHALAPPDDQLAFLLRRAVLGLSRGLAFSRAHTRATSAASSLKAMTEHMIQAEKLASLGQIAAGVVHELNNPLTTIVAYTDFLRKKARTTDADPGDVQRLERISESANRILRFARDLVAYARPASEAAGPVFIDAVIDQALAFCEHVLSEHDVVVERRFSSERLVALGMTQQLVQVFVNLITNACHAMPEEGATLVLVTERAPSGRVVARVSDNGHGIPPQHATEVFQPFFTTKVDGKGTGLGLSIVKNIIDRHEGTVVVEPQPVGVSFVLELPRAD